MKDRKIGEDRSVRSYIARQVLRRLNISSTLDGDWLYDRESTQQWWQTNGTKVRTAILAAVAPVSVNYDVVVHMRLGDVPFGELTKKKSCYHMQRYGYYQWAFQRLGIENGARVLLVYSTRWKSQPEQQTASQAYVDAWVKRFQSRFVVETQSSSDPLVDFRTMVCAPKFIGSTGSFAFVAGIGRPDNAWCMPMLGPRNPKTYLLSKTPPVWMIPIRPLLHAEVRNRKITYTDVDQVVPMLEENGN